MVTMALKMGTILLPFPAEGTGAQRGSVTHPRPPRTQAEKALESSLTLGDGIWEEGDRKWTGDNRNCPYLGPNLKAE
jgi:hypothetical protein